jgi:hypothetical protein
VSNWEETEYTVLLLFPGFGAEGENAEEVVECALGWLNTHKEEPGFRFAPPVSAHLEIVRTSDEARDRIDADERVAMVLVHGLDGDERDALLRVCNDRHVAACVTVDAPRRAGSRDEPFRFAIRKKVEGEPSAHSLSAETLTAPVGEDEQTQGRVGEVIAVLALGVMQHHWELVHGGPGDR